MKKSTTFQMAGHVEAGTIFHLNIQKQTHQRKTPAYSRQETRSASSCFLDLPEKRVVSKFSAE